MRPDNLFHDEMAHNWGNLKQNKGFKHNMDCNAILKRGLSRHRPSRDSLQHGLEVGCSIQELNRDNTISEQKDGEVQNPWVSFKFCEL